MGNLHPCRCIQGRGEETYECNIIASAIEENRGAAARNRARGDARGRDGDTETLFPQIARDTHESRLRQRLRKFFSQVDKYLP